MCVACPKGPIHFVPGSHTYVGTSCAKDGGNPRKKVYPAASTHKKRERGSKDSGFPLAPSC